MSTQTAVERRYSTTDVAGVIGAHARQVHRWCEDGMLGPRHVEPGSGTHRVFDDGDLEVADALRSLASLGCTYRHLHLAASCIRNMGRVREDEWLFVTAEGCAMRGGYFMVLMSKDAHWAVPLRSSEALANARGTE